MSSAVSGTQKQRWLLTAFEPFLQRDFNQSERVLREIERLHAANATKPGGPHFELHTKILPTEYETCELVLLGELTRIQKEVGPVHGILSLGEGREEFKIETQANNMDHAPNTADNAGIIRNRQVIFSQLPEALPISFPFEAFSLDRSINPGFFVCNHLCARMSVRQHQDPAFPRFGFIHVPRLEFTPQWTTEQCAKIIFEGLQRAS